MRGVPVIHVVIGCDRDAGPYGMCGAQVRVFDADTIAAAVHAAAAASGWSQTRDGKIECPRHGRNATTNGQSIISATGQFR